MHVNLTLVSKTMHSHSLTKKRAFFPSQICINSTSVNALAVFCLCLCVCALLNYNLEVYSAW